MVSNTVKAVVAGSVLAGGATIGALLFRKVRADPEPPPDDDPDPLNPTLTVSMLAQLNPMLTPVSSGVQVTTRLSGAALNIARSLPFTKGVFKNKLMWVTYDALNSAYDFVSWLVVDTGQIFGLPTITLTAPDSGHVTTEIVCVVNPKGATGGHVGSVTLDSPAVENVGVGVARDVKITALDDAGVGMVGVKFKLLINGTIAAPPTPNPILTTGVGGKGICSLSFANPGTYPLQFQAPASQGLTKSPAVTFIVS